MLAGLLLAQPKGTTALLDAVCLGMNYLKRARYSRRALVILSDGGDNHSRYTEREIQERVRESDLWIYAMGIFARPGPVGTPPRSKENLAGEKLLAGLAQASGGRDFDVDTLADLPAVAARISLELRNQYILGYRPANPSHDGKYHRVRVSLAEGQNLRVFWRPGYYGAAE